MTLCQADGSGVYFGRIEKDLLTVSVRCQAQQQASGAGCIVCEERPDLKPMNP